MYPLNTYLQPHNLEENQFEDVDTCRSKDEAIEAPDHDTFLGHFHRAQYFSGSSLDDAHNAVWGNSLHCSASFAARRMNCEGLQQEGLCNLSSSAPMSNSRKRKAEIVEVVHGSGGRKDKHSKVCTARGPRDRRVRLSPRTAIEFYDVQDRLGYDRPSKAIDWLIKEAKTAIDALEELQLSPLGSDHNQVSAANQGKLQTVSECGMVQKQEDLDHDDNHVSSFGFFLDRAASPIFEGDGFNTSGNHSNALENAILNPGGYQQGLISGLATNRQIFDTTWEVARLQRVLTIKEDSDSGRATAGVEYSSTNYLPLRFEALPIPAGNNQGFCQAENLQSGIVNYSPISISFPGFCLSNELSNVAAAAVLKDGAKERTTDLSKTPSFLHYHQGGISG